LNCRYRSKESQCDFFSSNIKQQAERLPCFGAEKQNQNENNKKKGRKDLTLVPRRNRARLDDEKKERRKERPKERRKEREQICQTDLGLQKAKEAKTKKQK